MIGVTTDGKAVTVNRDFSIRIPYGAGYDVFDLTGENRTVLTITRFDELPADYDAGVFTPRMDPSKYDVLSFGVTHALSEESLGQMNLAAFLAQLKNSTDEQLAKAAVGSAAAQDGSGQSYSVLKTVQDTPEIKAGYITNDLFVAANFMLLVFTRSFGYRATLKVPRQPQKFKRTEFFVKALLGSVKPNAT